MSKLILYVQLMEGRLEPDATSPTGDVIRFVGIDKAAVFDEATLDKAIGDTAKRLRELKQLKEIATRHSCMMSEHSVREYGVPFTVKKYVKKYC